MPFIYIILLPLMAIMAYQDFKERRVSLLLFLFLFAGLAFIAFGIQKDFKAVFTTFLLNCSFILVQLVCVKLYFILKNRRNVPVIDTQIGSGDILFFFIAAIAFSTANFIVFYLISLLAALITTLVFKGIKNARHFEIPLAGVMSILMSCCILYKLVNTSFSLYNDAVILSLFNMHIS